MPIACRIQERLEGFAEPGLGIPQFRFRHRHAFVRQTTHNQHPAIDQEGRRVARACQKPGSRQGLELAGLRIKQFGSWHIELALPDPTENQYTPIWQYRSAMPGPCNIELRWKRAHFIRA